MTPAQIIKYRAEWSRAWKAMREQGLHAGERADDVRKRWHLYVGAVYLRGPDAGRPKSSTVLTNREFDRFLMRCAAAHSPASLAHQLALDAQPLIRLRFATDPLFDLIDFAKAGEKREAYLRGIYANLQRPAATAGERVFAIEEMPDRHLQTIVATLTHTIQHKLGKAHGHPSTEHVSGTRARSSSSHRVGLRARKVRPASAPVTVPSDRTRYADPDPAYSPPVDDGNPF
ncbi:hypothetical protein OpiT1DRAFT_04011 [Opitutaceae bacterium TAV1]|nr:hypothetical protein OpiT1DRAFT_04011 [Opitutaceae bacterium TAV1]